MKELPTLEFLLYLRELGTVEDGVFNASATLGAIVVGETEDVFAKEEDGDEIADGEECHTEIHQTPGELKAG